MNKKELEQCNNMLDRRCVELEDECKLLKILISIMMKNKDQKTHMFKIVPYDPIYIKVENGNCTIIRGSVEDAAMQEENSEVCESEHQNVEEGGHTPETSCCD